MNHLLPHLPFRFSYVRFDMTQDELKSRLHYDPETGVFTWLDNPERGEAWRNRYPGTVAGTKLATGYISISLSKKPYLAHRLAFLFVHGYIPPEVDHIDGDTENNRIKNLRSVDRSTNMKNSRRSCANTSGKTGLCWDKNRNKWLAYINVNGKRIHNKRFKDRFDAERQRDKWNKMYDFHPNHGR